MTVSVEQQIPTVFLHIGLHKTGTTSFQGWLSDNRQALFDRGIAVFLGADEIHDKYLAYASLRPAVVAEADQFNGHAALSANIAANMDKLRAHSFVFSTEALSLLRTREECQALRDQFGNTVCRFVVLVVLRDKLQWFESFRNQIVKSGAENTHDPRSAFFLDPAGWLTDFDGLLEAFNAVFDDVRVLQYDQNDIIAPLLHQIDPELSLDTRYRRMNRRVVLPRSLRMPRRFLSKIFGTERKGAWRWVLRKLGQLG